MLDTVCNKLEFISLKFYGLEYVIKAMGLDSCKLCNTVGMQIE